MRLGLVLLTLLATFSARANVVQHPVAAWADSFLLSQALIEEYASVAELAHGSSELWQTLARSERGMTLWLRATLALEIAKAKQLNLGDTTAARAAMLEQKGLLEKAKHPQLALVTEAMIDLDKLTALVAATYEHVGRDEVFAKTRDLLALEPPSCPADKAATEAYAAILDAAAERGQEPRAADLAERFGREPIARLHCLARSLLGPEHEGRAEPLPYLAALSQGSPPDQTLVVLHVVRLLQKRRYAEALSRLYDLQSHQAFYRLPYETVQRIYNYRQKGKGAVALMGL